MEWSTWTCWALTSRSGEAASGDLMCIARPLPGCRHHGHSLPHQTQLAACLPAAPPAASLACSLELGTSILRQRTLWPRLSMSAGSCLWMATTQTASGEPASPSSRALPLPATTADPSSTLSAARALFPTPSSQAASLTLIFPGAPCSLCSIYDKVNGQTCHQCRQKTLGKRTSCSGCGSLQVGREEGRECYRLHPAVPDNSACDSQPPCMLQNLCVLTLCPACILPCAGRAVRRLPVHAVSLACKPLLLSAATP